MKRPRLARALTRLTRRAGFEVVRYPGGKSHWRRIAALLAARGVDVVLDVGANTGQYARALRRAGYGRRIVSFEPSESAHRELEHAASGDPRWQVAPAMALGERCGEATLHVNASSDMSSLLPMREEMARHLDSDRVIDTRRVPVQRLDAIWEQFIAAGETVFLKCDTQGTEMAVLEGAGTRLDAVAGLQLELSLAPIYEQEPPWLEALARVQAMGFEPHLVIPGYFSRSMQRMLQFDAVLMRPPPRAAPAPPASA